MKTVKSLQKFTLIAVDRVLVLIIIGIQVLTDKLDIGDAIAIHCHLV